MKIRKGNIFNHHKHVSNSKPFQYHVNWSFAHVLSCKDNDVQNISYCSENTYLNESIINFRNLNLCNMKTNHKGNISMKRFISEKCIAERTTTVIVTIRWMQFRKI